eukprot:TRINITY_DN12916_c0_g1_i1.p1 TRINITY_DN12916_c0_g1~~TRINITY_DN12916_c0_g1_i1.p1  ORF type:complete len:462 (+),score=55.75 TRINITY_DN12916_c0_g1_i1:51-1388(+)
MALIEYEKADVLGRGSYGTVYKVRRKADNKQFALKELICQDISILNRCMNEAVNMMRGEHLVPCLRCFVETEGCLYKLFIVMPCYDGSLEKYLQLEGKLSVGEVMTMLRHVCKALAVLHNENRAHRDVKPMNIFFNITESGRCYYLGDMGLAKEIVSSEQMTAGAGSPVYMPKEQNGQTYDMSVDMYALGMTACQAASSLADTADLNKALQAGFTAAELTSEVTAKVGPELARVITKLIDKKESRATAVEALSLLGVKTTDEKVADLEEQLRLKDHDISIRDAAIIHLNNSLKQCKKQLESAVSTYETAKEATPPPRTAPLPHACTAHDWESCKKYKLPQDVVTKYKTWGATPLHAAAETGNLNLVKQIFSSLNGGLWINAPDKHHQTPLYLASLYGQLDVVKALILHGADPRIPSSFGSPLSVACSNGAKEHYTAITALLQNSA